MEKEPGVTQGRLNAMTTKWILSLAGVLMAGLCATAGAAAAPAARVDSQVIPDAVDVSRLPIDLDRIHRALQASSVREERDGLNLRYFVEVYGQAHPIELFGPDANLAGGPVPYGAPTHREMLQQMTPQEFRAPAADVSALLRWLLERAPK